MHMCTSKLSSHVRLKLESSTYNIVQSVCHNVIPLESSAIDNFHNYCLGESLGKRGVANGLAIAMVKPILSDGKESFLSTCSRGDNFPNQGGADLPR